MRFHISHFVAFAFFVIFKFFLCNAEIFGESTVTTLSLIADYGYPGEEHTLTTVDDYILTLFRIPYSPKNSDGSAAAQSKRPVVFLMHGFGQSSSDWVLSGYPRGLAFFLSDAGYDVWMGNARGTRYSKGHETLLLIDPKYWDFSWHEIGVIDLSANVNYIMENTSSAQVQYIGHSQGTTAFLVAASLLPSFNEKISAAFLLAPVAFMSHATTPVMAIGAALLGYPRPSLFGANELLPNSALAQTASSILCGNFSLLPAACSGLSFTLFGADSSYTNNSAIELYFKTSPAGSSIKQLIHYLQLFNSKRFCQYDYGFIENLFFYQQLAPPDYPVENIQTPVYVYHSENDALAAPTDVERLLHLMQPTTVAKVRKLPFQTWNHLDFILANDVDVLLYDTLLQDMREAAAKS